MNPEIKAKWLEALRSGKYEQGKGVLRDAENRFCCLGVLCDLISPDSWDEAPSLDNVMICGVAHDVSAFGYHYATHSSDTDLPFSLRTEVSLSADDQEVLIGMNDDGRSFAEIADHIEQHC